VSWRGIGCLAVAFGGFVIIAVIGIWVSLGAGTPVGCAPGLRWIDDRYVASGTPAPSPDLPGGGVEPLRGCRKRYLLSARRYAGRP